MNKNVRKELLRLALAIGIVLMVAGLNGCRQDDVMGVKSVRERIAIDARDDCYLYNGADLTVYSDSHSTTVASIDGATGNIDSAGAVSADTVSEHTSGSGVTIDSVVLKDGGITATAAVVFTNTLDVNGTEFILDADGDTSLTADTDDQIDVKISNADDFQFTANTFSVLSGSALDMNGTNLVLDDDADSIIAASLDDVITVTLGAAAGYVNVATGSLKVGNGTPSVSLNGEDAYVEGTFEVDGTSNLAGAVTFGGNVTMSTFAIFGEGAVQVVTEGGTITAVSTNQPITSTAAVTTSTTTAIADGATIGQLLILRNENASDAIIIDNGANTFLSGNITLGTGDTLTMMWDGTNWVGIATSDNS